MDRVVSAHTADGRLSEPVAVLGRLGKPKSASVIYVLTALDDRRGWVTRVDLVRRVHLVGEGGVLLTDPTQASGPTRLTSRP